MSTVYGNIPKLMNAEIVKDNRKRKTVKQDRITTLKPFDRVKDL